MPPKRSTIINPLTATAAAGLQLGVLGLGTLSGCSGQKLTFGAGPAYPAELRQERVLDIEAYLRPTSLELTNTTATAYPAGRLWLNRRFSAPTPELGVGESLDIPLKRFKDEFGEVWRGGGFFAARTPERLVLTQLETTVPQAWADAQSDAGPDAQSNLETGTRADEAPRVLLGLISISPQDP